LIENGLDQRIEQQPISVDAAFTGHDPCAEQFSSDLISNKFINIVT